MDKNTIRLITDYGDDVFLSKNGDCLLITFCDKDTQRFFFVDLTEKDIDKLSEAIHSFDGD